MKIPLKPKRTDYSYRSGIFDYKYIREHAPENPFGIKPNPPPVVLKVCSAHKDCTYVYDAHLSKGRGTCKGVCSVG